jgi:hypothetical protein
MTLATAILLLGIYSTGLSSQNNSTTVRGTPQSSTPATSSTNATQDQNGATNQQAPATNPPSSAQSTTSPKPRTTKKRVHKKPPSVVPCDAPTATTASNGSNPAPELNTPAAADTTQGSSTAPAKNCPPEKKTIVRQGGTAEPSIQLAGSDQASQKRNDANQMLGSTEENLKKIAELQLSAAQKDTVAQIRQFVDQSKAALADGDVERGSTLAWKAKLLSDDLVTPQK